MAKRPLNLGGAAPARAGHAFENKTRAELERAGWYVVATPPANDRGIDLIAVKRVPGTVPSFCLVLAVQCKRDGYMSPAEREQLFKVAAEGLMPVLASRDPYGDVMFRELFAPLELPARGFRRFVLSELQWRIDRCIT